MLFTLALLLSLLIRTYFMHGNFGDGVLYDSMARDISIGFGTPWAPKWFNAHGIAVVFHEHPSFSMFLNSLFYKIFSNSIFSNSIFISRLYIFTTFSLC